MMTETRPVKRGRPRDPAVDQAILDAARMVLARKGFTGTSMDEIARQAGVGKDTLYRRWKSKEELVLHLLSGISEQTVKAPDLDDARYALFLFLQAIRKVNLDTDLGPLSAGVVGESARNERLAAGFHEFWRERRSIPAALVRRIAPPGTTDDAIEVILDHVLGPMYYRILLTGAPIDDEYLWELIGTSPWSTDVHSTTPELNLNSLNDQEKLI